MKITWDHLLERIKETPLDHLGGFSPRLLYSYFLGYEQALVFHGRPPISGTFGLSDFNRWFYTSVYGGPQGWASCCLLLTNTEEKGLELFFEFRQIAKGTSWENDDTFEAVKSDLKMSALEFIKSDAIRKQSAMYFGSGEWLRGIWALWNGYLWAENDLGVESSTDRDIFLGFQEWLRQRHPFGQEANFGKLFEFLAFDQSKDALENFFDQLELYLDGAKPDARTKKFQTFLDEAIASVLKDQGKQGH